MSAMWKSRAVSSEQLGVSSKARRAMLRLMGRLSLAPAHCPLRTFLILLLTAHCLLLTAACRRDMQDQPKMKPYRASSFFRDGNASRQIVPGTVARRFL